jgi:uncharacterized RDD family membrane protein YckC
MKDYRLDKLIGRTAAMLLALVQFSLPAAASITIATDSAAGAATTNATPLDSQVEGARVNQRNDLSHRDVVQFGRNVELKAGQKANDIVVIGGSATVGGKVRDSVVTILGSANVEGETKDAVSILGNVRLGTNAHVRGDVVAVLGNVKLSRGANIHGDVVAVGGSVDREEGAVIDGDVVSLPGVSWLGDWLEQCVFKFRPLAPQLGWLWVVAAAFLLLYLLTALAFPRPVNACKEEIANRPATTLLIGLATKILLPIITLILLVTGIGIFVVPFLFAVVMFAGIIGKVALLQYVGQQLGRRFGSAALESPLATLLLGWILLTLLYLVPILGMVVYGVTGVWALGAAVMAMFGGTRREMPECPISPTGSSTPAPTSPASAPSTASAEASALAAPPMTGSAEPGPTPPPIVVPAGATTGVAEALAFPRANFWERMGAAFLDVVLVGILGGLVGGPPLGFLVALAYFAGMWTWKGTTVGGIVLNLKVVRLDGSPLTFAAALVRGLAAAFSVIVLFLGFLWIIWDREKQGWHDRIAGTVVLRLPRGTPLVCL